MAPDSAQGTPGILPATIPAGNVIPQGKSSRGFREMGEKQGESVGRVDLSHRIFHGCLDAACGWFGIWGDFKAGGGAGCPGMMGAGRSGMSWENGSQEGWDVLMGARRSGISWDDGNQENWDILR